MTESEDLISGVEYSKRLREQFERLYPVPEWVNPPLQQRSVKNGRRRSQSSLSMDEDGATSDVSTDSDDLSTQPLAKLLKTTAFLQEPSLTQSRGRRKLRAEVIDIQRTKDVGDAQPVCVPRTYTILTH